MLISLPFVGYGTHLQATSPNYASYQQHQIDIIEAAKPGKDLAPGLGLGLVMAGTWPFTVMMQGFLILLFIASVLLVRIITEQTMNRNISWGIFLAFSVFWTYGMFLLLRTAADNFKWAFTLLALANVFTFIGLITGSIGLFKEISNQLLKRDAAKDLRSP